ncbi:hypothetical protein CHS0354_028761 [Potamilus streckersoni]|uniref:Uncharacterized protein n=1 Tax=Potamilus streckersoni TaxID=2493646 RepID=A0AAE0VRJ3_9BIVA|nr:hypothetical protein CHS0354_028761 [Potamilus streckersoni]
MRKIIGQIFCRKKTMVRLDLDPLGLRQRLRRSVDDPPDVFHAHFTVANTSVKLNLTRNFDVTANVPVYIWRNGVLYRTISDIAQGTGLYQDHHTGSSVLLKCPYQEWCEMVIKNADKILDWIYP